MPSRSLDKWINVRLKALNQIASAHAAVGGAAPGRRHTTQHINQAYVMLLSGQFQGFCRDLHSEAVDVLLGPSVPGDLRTILIRARLTSGRKLDRENANPGNLGIDFQLFGFKLWEVLNARSRANETRNKELTQLNLWRNAIAHQEFAHRDLGGRSTVRLTEVTRWRSACEALAIDLDAVVGAQVATITGVPAW